MPLSLNNEDLRRRAYIAWLQARGQVWLPAPRPRDLKSEPQQEGGEALDDIAALPQTGAAPCTACGERHAGIWPNVQSQVPVVFVGDLASTNGPDGCVAFTAAAADLFEKMAQAMHLTSYLAIPFVPCQRLGSPDQFSHYRTLLIDYLRIISPLVVVTMGHKAASALLGMNRSFTELQGRWQTMAELPTTQIMPTFHPRDLLRYAPNKKLTWADLQAIVRRLPNTR